jgi:site-specific DNA-methyltransferase (cytosine-N4-specific)
MVLDPFGGSCVTGEAAEHSLRRWMCCEIDRSYLEGALARFEQQPERKNKAIYYRISSPCAVPVDEHDAALPLDNGRNRPLHLLAPGKVSAARFLGDKTKARAVRGRA